MRKRGVLATLALAVAIAGAAAVQAFAFGSGANGGKVGIKLVEFKLQPAVKSTTRGKIAFVVHNAGKIPHQFVVLRTTAPASKLPTKGAQAVETGRIGKLSILTPGSTKRLTVALKAGHYVLICNLPGHYKAGQFADFTVR